MPILRAVFSKLVATLLGFAIVFVVPASAARADDEEFRVTVKEPAMLVAAIEGRCERCAWNVEGREAAVVALTFDGRYSQHLPLVRGGTAEYRVLLGAAAPGTHVVRVALDTAASARELRAPGAASARVTRVETIGKDDPRYEPLTRAPMLYARPNTIGRFTDVPVFAWYEREPTGRGTRYRYSVVFTNEDGGTPTDRLMATWGRTTDIEYVYSAEVGSNGDVLAEDIQGPEHEILQFAGKREGRNPLLWVSTENNMVLPHGTAEIRYAPAPVPFDLSGVSREAVMDAHPWLYAVAAQELEREGKIVANGPPGNKTIPDPRTFVYVEACGTVGNAALAFEVDAGGTWWPSDRGVTAYRIVRDGCFRAAVPVATGTKPRDIRGVRVLAHARPPRNGEAAQPPNPIRLDRINTVFMLDGAHRPGEARLTWQGPATITPAAPLEVRAR
jgi:hypothetical protein